MDLKEKSINAGNLDAEIWLSDFKRSYPISGEQLFLFLYYILFYQKVFSFFLSNLLQTVSHNIISFQYYKKIYSFVNVIEKSMNTVKHLFKCLVQFSFMAFKLCWLFNAQSDLYMY